jgi:hypothetical protein
MTIAAGFLCDDGIVVCSDTEHTGGSKLNRPKIFTVHDDLILSGAGDSTSIKWVVEALERHYKNSPNFTINDVRAELERTLLKLYKTHIHPFYRGDDPDRPDADILAAVRDRDGTLALFSSANTQVTQVDRYEVLGTGAVLGHFIADWLFDSSQNVKVVKIIGLYIVGQAKRHALYCGGETQLYILPKQRMPRSPVTFWDESTIIRSFHDDLKPALVGARDNSITDAEFEGRLTELMKQLRQVRAASTAPSFNPFDKLGDENK